MCCCLQKPTTLYPVTHHIRVCSSWCSTVYSTIQYSVHRILRPLKFDHQHVCRCLLRFPCNLLLPTAAHFTRNMISLCLSFRVSDDEISSPIRTVKRFKSSAAVTDPLDDYEEQEEGKESDNLIPDVVIQDGLGLHQKDCDISQDQSIR